MNEQALTLDDVRLRFLDAQAQLSEAASAVEAIRQSAEHLGRSREGLIHAGTEVASLGERFGSVADALAENAERLREGVDAIRLGDPAAIRRQIEELDSSFTALQAVLNERLGKVEAAERDLGTRLDALNVSFDAQHRRRRREGLVLALVQIVALLVMAVLVLFR